MAAALRRREQAGPAERDIYASYINEAFLTALEKHADRIVFQFSLGAEPMPYETGEHPVPADDPAIGRDDRPASAAALPVLSWRRGTPTRPSARCARELPNLSLAGYWWHNFFPDSIRQVIAERLDMLPLNKQIGFFSDAYCVEWVYGKARMAQKQLARVLAEKIEQGQYTRDDALSIAAAILYDTPRDLLHMIPASPSP